MYGTAPKRVKTTGPPVSKRSKVTKRAVPRSVTTKREPFAKQITRTLIYAEQVTRSLSTGLYNEYKISCNSLFDPNTTGVGHQPMYYDQLMAIYDHYCVTEAKITVVPVPESATTKTLTVCLFQDDDTNTNTTDMSTAMERPGATFSSCQAQVYGPTPSSLSARWSAKQVFAGNPLSREDLSGNAGASPTEESYFIIAAADASSTTSTMLYNIRVEYTATFYELKSVVAS